jgi:PAS domain S-box-containing protein
MPKLSNQQASTYAAAIFILTVILSYLYPDYNITVSGLLVVIILSVFVDNSRSTILAGIISALVFTFFKFFKGAGIRNSRSVTEYVFVLLLILFATLIVIYLKRLFKHVNFDKSQMTSLFENATEGILLTDNSGKIILVNPAAKKMFGYEEDELIGHSIEILVPGKSRKAHEHLRTGFYQSPQNRMMGEGRDLNGIRKDGFEIPVEVSLSYYKQNNKAYVIAFIVDITQRKHIEINMLQQKKELERMTGDMRKLNTQLEAKVEERTIILKEALQRLEQSQKELSEALDKERQLNEIKSRFVSMASHEFRTPLSTVLSSATLLSKYTAAEEQPQRSRHIDKIKNSVKHLNDILNDFLSLGRLDEGKVETRLEEFNLKEFMNETVEEMRGLLKKDQYIQVHYTGTEVVHSDSKLLKNVMINLITNASKFSDENLPIEIRCITSAENARVEVKDHGIGISQEDQQHLFSSFFRGSNALNIQGTGLGLHIVKRMVDLLGGEIHLQSELNKGTIFTFIMPINKS